MAATRPFRLRAVAAPAPKPASSAPSPVLPIRTPRWLPSPNYTPGRAASPVALAIHTMGGGFDGCGSWFASPASQVSSHYGAALDGRLDQYVGLEHTAWVNGRPEPGNRWGEVLDAAGVAGWVRDLNPNTLVVGIETDDAGSGATAVTDALYAATRDACRLALRRYPGLVVVTGHHVISPSSRKNCPGKRWTASGRLAQLARELGLALVA